MIYQFMHRNSARFEIGRMAKLFKVSRAGYYKHLKQTETKQQRRQAVLLAQIKRIYHESRDVYGSPRIHRALKQLGEHCSRRLIAKLMRINQIQAKSRRKWRPASKTCRDMSLIAPNLVAQNFTVALPNQVWAADITYVRTREGWLYVAMMMDLFSRKIVGLSMGDRMDTSLIKSVLKQAICHRQPPAGLVLHSDRGSQYASREYRFIAESFGFRMSMSAKGHCYDNAVAESFFKTLKTEHVYFQKYETRQAAALSIFEYVEVFYNRRRSHSTLNYLSPEEFEQQNKVLFQAQSRVKLALPAIEVKL